MGLARRTLVRPREHRGLIEAPASRRQPDAQQGRLHPHGTPRRPYLAYRKAIQEVVSRQLADWGDARDAAEDSRRRATRPLERDLERVLLDLADDFPLLATLVERRRDGQRFAPDGPDVVRAAGRDAAAVSDTEAATGPEPPPGASEPTPPPALEAKTPEPDAAPPGPEPAPAAGPTIGRSRGRATPGRLGLGIQFDERPDDPELGRLIESTVSVNDAHPAYRRAAASRAEGYHVALAVAMALAPLTVEPSGEHGFVTTFLPRWGEAVVPRRATRARRAASRRP